MKIQIKLIAGVLIAAAAPVLVGCGETPQEQPQEVALETTDARLSYGIGQRMGQRMAADGMTVDVPAYAAGLEDALAGGEAMLTDDEINAEMTAFQERDRPKRRQNESHWHKLIWRREEPIWKR